MFQETSSLLERYSLAAKAGFKAVECAFPYDYPVQQVVDAKEALELEQILLNIHVGT
jgi:hydroxypyruvate isomerase